MNAAVVRQSCPKSFLVELLKANPSIPYEHVRKKCRDAGYNAPTTSRIADAKRSAGLYVRVISQASRTKRVEKYTEQSGEPSKDFMVAIDMMITEADKENRTWVKVEIDKDGNWVASYDQRIIRHTTASILVRKGSK